MGITGEVADGVIREFYNEFPSVYGHIGISYRETQEDYYGPKGSIENVGGRIKGAFLPRSREVHLPLANFRDAGDLRKSLRHEVLGHYGTLTFTASDKRALLEVIAASRAVPSLKAGWDFVNQNYRGLGDMMKAEEVFCLFAETVEGDYGIANTRFSKVWDEVVSQRARPLQRQDLLVIAMSVAHGIQKGIRPQQIFPEDDFSQFRSRAHDGHGSEPIGPVGGRYVGVVLSVVDGVVLQKVGRAGETMRHSVDALSAPVTPGVLLDVRYENGWGHVAPGVAKGALER